MPAVRPQPAANLRSDVLAVNSIRDKGAVTRQVVWTLELVGDVAALQDLQDEVVPLGLNLLL